MKWKLFQHILEKCINPSFCWNKRTIHETLGPESNLKKRGSGPKFHKTDKNLFIFISFHIQKLCHSVTSCPDFFFACQSFDLEEIR